MGSNQVCHQKEQPFPFRLLHEKLAARSDRSQVRATDAGRGEGGRSNGKADD